MIATRGKGIPCDILSMCKVKVSDFRKSSVCPSSLDLLRFQESGVPEKSAGAIGRHLAECEFCVAEVEFYRHYPQPDDSVTIDKLPEPLRQLAEAILRNNFEVAILGDQFIQPKTSAAS